MGMLLRRHKISTNEGATKVDYRELNYQELKRYAKEKGVDIHEYRSKDDIFEQLDLLNETE